MTFSTSGLAPDLGERRGRSEQVVHRKADEVDRGLRASHKRRGDQRDKLILARSVALLLGLGQQGKYVAVELFLPALLLPGSEKGPVPAVPSSQRVERLIGQCVRPFAVGRPRALL